MIARTAVKSSAQAIVEFAVAVPLFLLLMLGLIDFSRAAFTYTTLVNGTHELARTLSVPATSNATAISAFQNTVIILGPTNPSTDVVTVTAYGSGGTAQGSQTGACTLPLSTGNCTVPARTGLAGGWIDVTANYSFTFAPAFRGPFGIAFVIPTAVFNASTRAYIE